MNRSTNGFKTGTVVVMTVVWIASIFNVSWLWGLIFLLWGIYIVMSGDATIVETVTRRDNPVWFWFIAGSWILLSLALFVPQSWWG